MKDEKAKFSKRALTSTEVGTCRSSARGRIAGKNPNNGSLKTVRWPRMAGHLLLLPEVADLSPQVLESHG
jgi:hypothetical protein